MNTVNADPSIFKDATPDEGLQLQKVPDIPKAIVIPQSEEASATLKQSRLESLDPFSLPKSYRNNSLKERTLLDYVENFRRQFIQLFPQRPELLLCPLNECGTRKFVCSSVRPTLLKFPRTYDLQQCATFISDYFRYIPLESPVKMPDFLPAPTTVIRLREGDCLDISNVLTSILRGSGFDAYVVSGYAPMWITMQDQSSIKCPLLHQTEWVDEDIGLDDDGDEASVPEGRYNLQDPKSHTSQYIEMLARKEKEEAERLVREEALRNQTKYDYKDEYQGRRVHFWVLVKAGKRDVEQDIFIESTTGAMFKLDESPYHGIESIWSDINYWANVQKTAGTQMSFDLNDSKAWEFVLIKEPPINEDDLGDLGAVPEALAADANANESGTGGEGGNSQSGDGPVKEEPTEILIEPPSWATRVEINRDSFESVFPEGRKVIFYHRCNVEKYSEHYDGMKGLVLKLTLFEDDHRQHIQEIREIFARRRDLLIKRVTIPSENCVKLHYDTGKPSGIKDLIEVEGKTRLFRFYPGARVDGLVRRFEFVRQKFIEDFRGCDNFLLQRRVAIDPPNSNIRRLKGFSINPEAAGEHPVRKIVEIFGRNHALAADADIRKRTSYIDQGKIKLDYHYGHSRITASTRTYSKDGSDAVGWQADPLWKMPRPAVLREEFNSLVQTEKELMSLIRGREADFNELIQQLKLHMTEVVLVKTIHEKAREKSIEDEKNLEGAEKDAEKVNQEVDYLSPFLAQFPAGKPLTREQAEQARDECMASLTERLLERANIIQRRLNEENETLKKREAAYQRSQGAHSEKDDEDFNEFYEQTMFRIHILDARLHRHEKMAMKKFKELDMKLRADSRLEVIYQ